MNRQQDIFLSPNVHLWAVLLATIRSYLKRNSAYTIQLVRWPLGIVFTFAIYRVTYGISGRTHVGAATVSGFLLIGILGLITWMSSIWASGYALEYERYEGTSGALFLSPASRAAVVAGYGLGSFLWFSPAIVVVVILGLVTGAELNVSDPIALLASFLALAVASLAAGFAFSGLFILSRRGNLIANVMQVPLQLLSGIVVPLASLPAAIRPISNAVPATHAIIALRSAALIGASLDQVAGQVAWAFGLSLIFWLLGLVFLRRVEHVAKRAGKLELF
jgi:ABC-2 type transport system permease protein